MEISIETLTGNTFELRVSPFETVISVKAKIQRLEGIPISQQHLIWKTVELEDDYYLHDYGISHGSTLQLVLAMRGGPISTRRVPLEDPSLQEVIDYVEANGEDMWNDLPTSETTQVTVLLFRDGDQLNFFRVFDRGDGTLTPLSESLSGNSMYNLYDEDEDSSLDDRSTENAAMRDKVRNLKAKMRVINSTKKSFDKPLRKFEIKPSPPPRPPMAPLPPHLTPRPPSDLQTPRTMMSSGMVRRRMYSRAESSTSPKLPALPPSEEPLPPLSGRSRQLPKLDKPEVRKSTDRATEHISTNTSSLTSTNALTSSHALTGVTSLASSTSLAHAHATARSYLNTQTSIENALDHSQPIKSRISSAKPLLPDKPPKSGKSSHPVSAGITATKSGATEVEKVNQFGLKRYTSKASKENLTSSSPSAYTRQKTTEDKKATSSDSLATSASRDPHISSRLSSRVSFTKAPVPDSASKILKHVTYDINTRTNNVTRDLGTADGRKSIVHRLSSAERKNLRALQVLSRQGSTSPPASPTATLPATRLPPVAVKTKVISAKKKSATRCQFCKKKTGLATTYSCRCEGTFCAAHRYAETHQCSYDYKSAGRKILEQNNPVVTAPKLPKI